MAENIKTLLSRSTTQEEKINAANNIITNYKIHLTSEEIMSVFAKARYENNGPYYYSNQYTNYQFLLNYLLNHNVDMFIAITKCCSDIEKMQIFWKLGWCVSSDSPFYVGSNNIYRHTVIVDMYKNFLDYNNFDIDNLTMPDECRKEIEEYRSEKYGGRLTKSAKK